MSSFSRNTGVNQVKLIEVIEVKSLAGEGKPGSPYYEVTEYYSLGGELLARHNPTKPDKDLGTWSDEEVSRCLQNGVK